MNPMKIKFISYWLLVSGILISLTGLLHIAATPMMYHQMHNDPPIQIPAIQDRIHGFVYFFVVSGLFFLFAGLITAFAAIRFKRKENSAWIIIAGSGIFVAFSALGGIIYAKFGNPLIYLDVICSLSNLILLLLSIKSFNWHPGTNEHSSR